MLNLKDYGSSSDEDGPSESMPSSELSLGSSIDVKELSKVYAVNAAPDVLPPVSFQIIFFINYWLISIYIDRNGYRWLHCYSLRL